MKKRKLGSLNPKYIKSDDTVVVTYTKVLVNEVNGIKIYATYSK